MRGLTRVVLCLLSFFLLSAPSFAQGERGVLTGLVTDPTGAVIPEATVTATEVTTGVGWTVKSSGAGYYQIGAVPPGRYRLESGKEGFKTAIADNVVVGVAAVVTVNFALQVGSTKQSVTVTTEAPLLTPSSPEVGTSMTPEEVDTLPMDLDDGGRQLQDFIFASLPGAVGGAYAGSLNGGQLFSSEILIDGISIARYDMSGGSLDEFTPAADAAGEFKVQMSNFSAEYGETGGGVNNFGMKSGTNEFHGTAYEYFKNPDLNAAGSNINSLPAGNILKVKEPLRENNFGGTFGGPIRKNRTFFFLSFQGDRQRDATPGSLISVPTAAELHGDFSALLGPQIGTDALNRPVYQNEIYDPTTTRMVNGQVVRDPFPGNIIPPSEFSKASAQLLPLFPNPVNGDLFKNYPSLSTCCPRLDVNIWSVKVDHVLSEKHHLSSFFNWNDRPRYNGHGTLYPPYLDFPLDPIGEQDVHGRMFRISEDWTLNDHTLNHLAFGYNRFANPNGVGEPSGWNSRLGISGVADDCMAGFSFLQDQLGSFGGSCSSFDASESYIWTDHLSYVRGKHTLTFGTEIRRYRYNTRDDWGENGSFSFSDRETSLPGFYPDTGQAFASFILGAVDSGGRAVYTTTPGYRSKLFVVYAQDDWKATRKLTLNFGLRWEIPGVKKEAYDRMSGLDFTLPNPGADGIPGAVVFLGHCQGCNGQDAFQNAYYKEFAPRFGLAYAATQKLVIRGGYGISYGPPILNNFGSQNTWGYNGNVPLIPGTAPTGYYADPVIYWTPLVGAALPAAYSPGNGIGVPAFNGTLPIIDPTIANNNSIDYLPRDSARQPYVQNWSFGFQYQLPKEVLLEANYIGSKGTRLLDSLFTNSVDQTPTKYMGLGDILADDFQTDLSNSATAATLASYGVTHVPYPSFEATNANPIVGQGLRPFPQYQGVSNNFPEYGSSTYHALQVTARKHGHGLNFIAAYTLSKTLDDTDSALYYPTGGAFGNSNFGQDFYNRRGEKSIAAFDYPQYLKLTWIYDLPFGQGKRWLSSPGHFGRLVSGWKMTAIQQYFSGDPLSIVTNQVTGIFNGPWGSGSVRANVVPGVPQKAQLPGLDMVNGTQYLNPAAFVDPPLSPINGFALQMGTAPRFLPNIRGPAQAGESFGVLKDTKINERTSMQFRASFFNVFNRTGLGDPDMNVDDGPTTFGRIFGPQDGPRDIMLALRLQF